MGTKADIEYDKQHRHGRASKLRVDPHTTPAKLFDHTGRADNPDRVPADHVAFSKVLHGGTYIIDKE